MSAPLFTTVTIDSALIEPIFAVIFALPTFLALTFPELSTVATVTSELVHFTNLSISSNFVFTYAVNL